MLASIGSAPSGRDIATLLTDEKYRNVSFFLTLIRVDRFECHALPQRFLNLVSDDWLSHFVQ